jgi:hypothetical protein
LAGSVGSHTIVASATDTDGLTSSVSHSYTVADGVPSVTLTSPVDGATFTLGSVANSAFSCTAGVGGALKSGTAGCSASIDGGPALASGTSLAGTAGSHTITATATDTDGQHTSVAHGYTVQYQLLGFFSPKSGSKVKAAKSVAVTIALADVGGHRIPDAEASGLASACRVTFSATGAQALGAACMTYNSQTHQFLYNWTPRSTTGAETINALVSYPPTATKTTKSEPVTITK